MCAIGFIKIDVCLAHQDICIGKFPNGWRTTIWFVSSYPTESIPYNKGPNRTFLCRVQYTITSNRRDKVNEIGWRMIDRWISMQNKIFLIIDIEANDTLRTFGIFSFFSSAHSSRHLLSSLLLLLWWLLFAFIVDTFLASYIPKCENPADCVCHGICCAVLLALYVGYMAQCGIWAIRYGNSKSNFLFI